MVPARPAAVLAALLLAAAALAGCGLADEVTLPTALPSASRERPTPSATLPSELPSPEPSTPTESATPEPTREPTQEPTSQAPTSEPPKESPTPTRTLSQAATPIPPSTPEATESQDPAETATPTESQTPSKSEEPTPTQTPEPTETASETPSESLSATSAPPTESSTPPVAESVSAAPDESASNPLPLWLGLGALVAAGGALALFLAAGSKRKSWDGRLDVERAQGQWVVAELVPALTNPASLPQEVAQHWAAAQPTLDQLDTTLASLVADAPDDSRARTARGIATSVTAVRSSAAAHVALVSSAVPDSQALGASSAAVRSASNQLATALGPPS